MKEQPVALQLAESLEIDCENGMCDFENITKAVAELRRLCTSETEGWRYANELEQERKRLSNLNKEILEVLKEIMSWEENETMTWAKKARAAIAAAKGEV